MRIGLDGFPLTYPKTGVGHDTFELARALAMGAPSDDFQLVSPLTSFLHSPERARAIPRYKL